MRRFSTVLMLAAVCIASKSHAQGTLQITFDGPPIIPPGTGGISTNYSESGMRFNPLGSGGFSRYGPGETGGGPDNGTAYLAAALTQSLMFSFTNGSQFGLVSVDLAEYSTAFQSPLTVHLVGYRQDGSTVSTDFITDGVIDGTGPLADFETFYFDKQWVGLTRVEVPGYGWSLDNLFVRPIPEPASALLLFSGGLLLWILQRKSRE